MLSREKIDAWVKLIKQNKDWKEIMEEVLKNIKEFKPLVLEKVKPEIINTCYEVSPIIIKDFGINPLPENVIDFLLDEVDPFSIHSELDTDELIRMYADWRRKQHYASEKWHNLYNALQDAGYIKCTSVVFNYFMDNKRLQDNGKIKWLKSKVDALYFQKKCNFTVKHLNECFQSTDGTPFKENNRSYTEPKAPLPDILKKLTDTLKAC